MSDLTDDQKERIKKNLPNGHFLFDPDSKQWYDHTAAAISLISTSYCEWTWNGTDWGSSPSTSCPHGSTCTAPSDLRKMSPGTIVRQPCVASGH